MKLVIVESPAKAKTINKYLGKDFKVVASFGHIRDLPPKNGSVLPEEDFEMKYEVSTRSNKYVDKIRQLAQKAEEIYLATDPDREGEAISWHVVEVLKNEGIQTDDTLFQRIAFNEITKQAVLDAVASPRKIDINLVNAQQARRALDYLVGFTISPILWRKLPGCRSAGRVQSVALKLICERETEIEQFIKQEYWTINIDFVNKDKDAFIAKLSHVDGKKLEKFSITNNEQSNEICKRIGSEQFTIDSISKKQQKRNPVAPFITSSLQQESARKLGFSAKKTMQIAQKLYEGIDVDGETVGLITYMRTDGVTIASQALSDIRTLIYDKYGEKYLPKNHIVYKSKSKNAQEAHEAIRPTNITLLPNKLQNTLDKDQLALYDLIWKRTMASQMESVVLDLVGVNLVSGNGGFTARSTGSTIVFDGFYKIYREGLDDIKEEKNNLLPQLFKGDLVATEKIIPNQHFTEPKPRYSEASLVKQLEELGIGRPSTYASIISVLQDRSYVKVEKKRFFPDPRGRLVTAFLKGFFKKYVEYDFTAALEKDLDEVAAGRIDWKDLLNKFWGGFDQNVNVVKDQDVKEVIERVQNALDFFIFGDKDSEEYNKNRQCPVCPNTTLLHLRLSKYGAFLACDNYPDCTFKKHITQNHNSDSDESVISQENQTKDIGPHSSGESIFLKKGPYGWYLQLGDVSTDKKKKPKRISLPAFLTPDNIDLETACKLIDLPMHIGVHPESGLDIHMNIGKFGPYLKYNDKYISIPKKIHPFSINLEESLKVIEDKLLKAKKNQK